MTTPLLTAEQATEILHSRDILEALDALANGTAVVITRERLSELEALERGADEDRNPRYEDFKQRMRDKYPEKFEIPAQAVKVPEEMTAGSTTRYEMGMADGWNACRAEVLRLNAPPRGNGEGTT